MDPNNTDTYEDSVQYVLRLLREAMGTKYVYFDGDPDMIAKFELPAISVEMVTDITEGGTMGEDDVADTLLIKIIFDKSKDWDAKRSPLNLTHRKVREAISARDPQGLYLPNTVKGALRREIYSDDGRIGTSMRIDYGFLERPESVFTSEGHITIDVKYPVQIPAASN